jgi:hypothetical protein
MLTDALFSFLFILVPYIVFFGEWSAQEFCSVGDDAYLILWDSQTDTSSINSMLVLLC